MEWYSPSNINGLNVKWWNRGNKIVKNGGIVG